jgi:hypothetical protein
MERLARTAPAGETGEIATGIAEDAETVRLIPSLRP